MNGMVSNGYENHNVGDKVSHVKDNSLTGTIIHVEENKLSVMVLWDGDKEPDFQWSNKVVKREENE